MYVSMLAPALCWLLVVLGHRASVAGKTTTVHLGDKSIETEEVNEIVEREKDGGGRIEPGNEYDILDEIVEITPLKADLARKMINRKKNPSKDVEEGEDDNISKKYDETQQTDNDGDYDDDGDLTGKAKRLYKLFNIKDLDDIIKVVPIKSINKLKGHQSKSREPAASPERFDYEEIRRLRKGVDDDDYDSYLRDELSESNPPRRRAGINSIDSLNREIGQLDDDIQRASKRMKSMKGDLGREKDLQLLLDRMIELQRKKLQALIKVREDHMNRAANIGQSITNIKKILNRTKSAKNKLLGDLAQEVEMEREGDYEDEDMEDNLASLENYVDSLDSDKRIITDKHKIQSITDITADEAKLLKKWHALRE